MLKIYSIFNDANIYKLYIICINTYINMNNINNN